MFLKLWGNVSGNCILSKQKKTISKYNRNILMKEYLSPFGSSTIFHSTSLH